MAYYVDTSALVKLIVAEPETTALRSWMEANATALVTSDLTRTELMRAVRRSDPDHAVRARQVLESLIVMSVSTSVFEHAGRLGPSEVRSLDAIHLTAALDLGDELDGLVTYDARQARAATDNGIVVIAPTAAAIAE